MSDESQLYTFNESKRKLNEISDILTKKLGSRWKVILFLVLILIIATIVLIITGINIPNYETQVSHIKVFFIVILLSVAFFCAWACIGPYTDTTTYGVVPFPPGTEYIPVDSTQCGISPTLCTGQECDTLCKNKDGKNKYGCITVNHPNVYYLGTKLAVGKSYCLPNIKQFSPFNDKGGCGTYTGRIVWTQASDGSGEEWECQCLYPDLYSGGECLTQVACTDSSGVSVGKLVDQTDGKTQWDPTNMSASLQNSNPYEKMSNGLPRFQCGCDATSYSTPTDPFVCNKNLCYVGMGSSPDALFDTKTNQCMCKGGLVKSNISGFCYPFDAGCNPNPNTGKCRYGVDIYSNGKRLLFKNGDRYYLSDKTGEGIEQLVDITDVIDDTTKNNIFDLSGTIMKDSFYSFPIAKPSGDLATLKKIISDVMTETEIRPSDQTKVSGKDAMVVRLNNIAGTASVGGGIAKLCNSYFYRRDSPNCDYQLNKEGAESIFNKDLSKIDCGHDSKNNPLGMAIPDITNNKGYMCICKNGTLAHDGLCLSCVPHGGNPVDRNGSDCCSGETYIDNNCFQACCNDRVLCPKSCTDKCPIYCK